MVRDVGKIPSGSRRPNRQRHRNCPDISRTVVWEKQAFRVCEIAVIYLFCYSLHKFSPSFLTDFSSSEVLKLGTSH